jgi:hypothetical protein
MSLTSFFSDMSHEMATSILPFFVIFVLGGNAAIVGLIEGASDGASSLVKSYTGYYSDKTGKRTPIMYVGYLLTTKQYDIREKVIRCIVEYGTGIETEKALRMYCTPILEKWEASLESFRAEKLKKK